MEAKDYINICAILLSPVIAVCITLWYQNRAERIKTKKDIFFTLMKNRTSRDVPKEWAAALNSINFVFHNDENIKSIWGNYYDNLCSSNADLIKRGHLCIDLLSAIAKDLGYSNLSQTQIDRYYVPQIHEDQFVRNGEIADEALRVLKATEHYGAPRTKDDNKKKP